MKTSQSPTIRIVWWGDSLIAGYEAHNPRLSDQTRLPAIGETIEITGWRRRGYTHMVTTALRARYPALEWQSINHGVGGATSADVLAALRTELPTHSGDVAVLGCGTNDVWRGFAGRVEAVGIDDYEDNLRGALAVLTAHAREVVMMEAPPIGWLAGLDTAAVNRELARYNDRARRAAVDNGVHFVPVWDRFTTVASALGGRAGGLAGQDGSLWCDDGVHLSDMGNHIMAEHLIRALIGGVLPALMSVGSSRDEQPPVAGPSLEVLDRVVTAEEYRALRAAVGWQVPALGQIEAALARSLAGVTVVSAAGVVVGMARLIGDGALYATLVDVVVAPDHQHTGIGSKMVDRLTRWARGRNIAHVSLTAAQEVVDFYRRAGFVPSGQSLRHDR